MKIDERFFGLLAALSMALALFAYMTGQDWHFAATLACFNMLAAILAKPS